MAAYYDLDGKKYVPKSRGGEVTVQGALIQNPTKTVSGAVVHFTDGADMPAESVIVNIEPVQSGTGTPSPDNVRPISGWDSVSASVTGVNAWDEEWEVGGIDTETGEFVNATNRIRSKNYIPSFPNTTYSFAFPSRASAQTGNIRVFFYDASKTFISYQNWIVSGTFTTPNGTRYMRFYTNGSYGETYQNDISINYPSTYTNYEPYQGQTITKDLGRTVYGGSLDVVNGVLTVDRAMVTLNGSESWLISTGDPNAYFYTFVSGMLNSNIPSTPIVCDKFPSASASERGNEGTMWGVYAQIHIHATSEIAPSGLTSNGIAELKAWLSANNTQVCYPLATPITIQLTPKQVTTLLGTNNVWADSGDVDLTYRRDINIVLDELTQAIISLGGNV